MSLNTLIAAGGTGVASPIQRYMQTRQAMNQERRNALAESQVQQSMRHAEQSKATEKQDREMKIAAAYMRPVLESVNPNQAYRDATMQLEEKTGIKSPPEFNPQMVQGLVNHVYGVEEKWKQGVSPSGAPMQQSSVSGKQIAGVAPSKSGQTINIDTKGESELSKALNKEFGKDLVTRRNDAIQAKDSLIATNDAIDLLDSGIITGTGAEYITSAGKMLRRIGINYFDDDVKNTEAYYANQAKQVAQVIKAFGSGTGLSDADREYAEKAAAGKITMSEGSLRKIIEMNQTASERVIKNFNKDVRKLKKGVSPFDLSIEVPTMKSPVKKQDEWSIKAL